MIISNELKAAMENLPEGWSIKKDHWGDWVIVTSKGNVWEVIQMCWLSTYKMIELDNGD